MNVVSVNDLASCIKQARKNLGWTQAELAERSGVSRDWIIGLERAKPGVELVLVLRTLKALNLPLSIDPSSPKGAPSEGINLDDVLNNTRSHDNRP
jgi:HTH-type transcriptional regulator/antitoxin HipB